jgi:hypothetical protein
MALRDLKSKPRTVPIGDTTVFVRSLTLGEIEQVGTLEKTDGVGSLKLMLSLGLVNEDGSPCTADDIAAVPMECVDQLTDAIRKASTPGSVDTIVKNSETTSAPSS